ncbi:MAG TPA: sigma 54-interacting transcriptional regulator [Clostridia bacterium]|nr:sigma 54-interacting transcriptional regulator [Clostridia bacterium]
MLGGIYTGYANRSVPDISVTEWESVLDSTQDAIFIDDMNGNTQWINRACEILYEVKREDVIGKSIDALEKSGIFSPSVAKLVFRSKEQATILHSNKSGKKILTTGTPIFGESGNIYKVISTSRDITELVYLRNQLEDFQNKLGELREEQLENIGNFIVKSEKMKEVAYLAKRLAQIDSTVLITGESGVGKGEIAKYIHMSGDRSDMPFVKVNCGAIPEALLESELFGYEYGAFTGSRKQGKLGLFQLAQHGTIFLDEIGELPLNLQVKILHVIQDKEIKMVGGLKDITVDVRIIAATNRDLMSMVKEKKFREDLFYRLNVVPIHIQALRERTEDIIPLTRYFLEKYNKKFNVEKRIDPNTMATLMKYSWPGNVRELENIIERLIIITHDDTILPQNLPNYILNKIDNSLDIAIPSVMSLKDATEEVERQIILNAVKKYKTTREVAKALKVSQPTIVRKMSKYHVHNTDMNLVDQ